MGGRSELLKLEEQMENQMKKKCAEPAVRERCSSALRGFALQPLCSRLAAFPCWLVGWLASLLLIWHIPIHLGSPHNRGTSQSAFVEDCPLSTPQ